MLRGPKNLLPVEAEREDDAAGVKGCARNVRFGAGVEVGPTGELGERGTDGDFDGDEGRLGGDGLGVAVAAALVGVTGVGGKRIETGEVAGEIEERRKRGRNEGGMRLLADLELGLRIAAKSGSRGDSMKLSFGPSASMITALSVFDQSAPDDAGESEARMASMTSCVNWVEESSSIEVSASQSEDLLDGFLAEGESVDLLELVFIRLIIGACLDTPELSASMIVESSNDNGIPGDGVLSVGARRILDDMETEVTG
jgi:hypothetical protein